MARTCRLVLYQVGAIWVVLTYLVSMYSRSMELVVVVVVVQVIVVMGSSPQTTTCISYSALYRIHVTYVTVVCIRQIGIRTQQHIQFITTAT